MSAVLMLEQYWTGIEGPEGKSSSSDRGMDLTPGWTPGWPQGWPQGWNATAMLKIAHNEAANCSNVLDGFMSLVGCVG